jgi:hypothetical protein
VVLHITGAHSHSLADRTLAFLLEQPENLQPRRIGHGLEREHELLVGKRHVFYQYTQRSIWVNVEKPTTANSTLQSASGKAKTSREFRE